MTLLLHPHPWKHQTQTFTAVLWCLILWTSIIRVFVRHRLHSRNVFLLTHTSPPWIISAVQIR